MAGIAHDISKKWRSDDIKTEDNSNFSTLLLSKQIQDGLTKCGFVKPSPIQLQAIPLGRCGLDLIIQAKSGTGKTCVFTVIALEGLLKNATATQVLVLAPTREIAYQIQQVVTSIGREIDQLKCCTFIGGLSVADDKNNLKNCQIAIGTPGRIKHLIEMGSLKTNSIRLFILDEADKLLDESFQESINWIYKQLPSSKQMLALSATYPEALANLLKDYMRNPFIVRLNADQPALIGIKQYYKTTKFHRMPSVNFQNKVAELLSLLKKIHFSQCLVFLNSQVQAQSLGNELSKNGWPTTFITGAQDQFHRLSAMNQIKTFKCRILVSTDLTSRGIDIENVNLIINMDVARDLETYLHRIGRAGRFGSQGIAVTIVSDGKESVSLFEIANQGRLEIIKIPHETPEDLWSYNPESPCLILEELKPLPVILPRIIEDAKIEPPKIGIDVPQISTITLNESDFDWLKPKNAEFPKFKELTESFDSFVKSHNATSVENIPDKTKFHMEYEADIDEELSWETRDKLMNFVNESRTNFWMSLAKHCNRNTTTVIKDEATVTTLDDDSLLVTDKKIEPVPGLLTNMTESKRRMMSYYQSLKSASPTDDKLVPEKPPSKVPKEHEISSSSTEESDQSSSSDEESDQSSSSDEDSDQSSSSDEETDQSSSSDEETNGPFYSFILGSVGKKSVISVNN